MTQYQFSQETINQAIEAIKGQESEIKKMKDRCGDMPIEEIAQIKLIEEFGIAQVEAEEIVEDLNKGIAEFDKQYEDNTANKKVEVKEKLAELTKGMSDEERLNSYANILTTLQMLKGGKNTQNEVENLLKENSKKDVETLVMEIEYLLNNNINLDNLANTVKNDVNLESITEIAKQIKNKEDYKFMTALWLYILQRDGKVKLTDSEIPMSAQMLGALSGASIEAIIATSELEEGTIDLERWQKVMKWILGALLFTGLLLLVLNVIGVLMFASAYALLDVFGLSAVGITITLVLSILLGVYVGDKALKWGYKAIDFLGEVYNKNIGPFTEKVRAMASKVKEWVKSIGHAMKTGVENSLKSTLTKETESQSQPVNEEEQKLSPAWA